MGVGFEPTKPLWGLTDFKSVAFDHSAIPPWGFYPMEFRSYQIHLRDRPALAAFILFTPFHGDSSFPLLLAWYTSRSLPSALCLAPLSHRSAHFCFSPLAPGPRGVSRWSRRMHHRLPHQSLLFPPLFLKSPRTFPTWGCSNQRALAFTCKVLIASFWPMDGSYCWRAPLRIWMRQ